MSKRALIMLRGLPGSGKSTVAELFNAPICTADDFHMRNGKYMWTQENAGKAHVWCQNKVREYMEANIEKIVVANTSTTQAELAPYADMARKYGYDVFYLIVENRHNGQNVHDVPQTTLDKMRSRFDVKL